MEYHKLSRPILILILAMGLASCADNAAVRLRYEAERLYYQADRLIKETSLVSGRTRNQNMKAAADFYGETLDFTLLALDSISVDKNPLEHREVRYLAFQSANRLTSLYFQARHFDTCVSILSRLLAKAEYEGAAQVTTNISLGRALQASGQWDSALTVYRRALNDYYPPVDDSGEVVEVLFRLPLHIYQIVNAAGDSTSKSVHYQEARKYYQSLIALNSTGKLTLAAHTALARVYHEAGQWDNVIAELRQLEDSSGGNMVDIQVNIADIYARMPGGVNRATALYDSLLTNLAPEDSVYRPRLSFKIALMYMEQSKYREAREILIDIKRTYPKYYLTMPSIQFAIARSFELLGRWNRAETEYKYLIEKFRGSEKAMATYLYLGDYYRDQGRSEEAEKWYRDAEEYYDEMVVRGAGTMIEAQAMVFKADLYRRWDDYQKCAELLVALFDKYPESEPGRNSLLQAASIYRNRLDQPQRADSLVERLRAMLIQPEEGWGT